MKNKKWYCIEAEFGHVGAGHSIRADIYIYTFDPIEVLNKYGKIPRVKKKNKIPTIRELFHDEACEIERRIISEKGSKYIKDIKKSSGVYIPKGILDHA